MDGEEQHYKEKEKRERKRKRENEAEKREGWRVWRERVTKTKKKRK